MLANGWQNPVQEKIRITVSPIFAGNASMPRR
jgi:hypothetical protein